MLASANVNNASQDVYTVPAGKNALVEIFIWANQAPNDITLKINNLAILTRSLSSPDLLQLKITLNEGDVINVSTTNDTNVHVAGLLI